jgi:cytoskeletal protein CcmA (bactofilin family)
LLFDGTPTAQRRSAGRATIFKKAEEHKHPATAALPVIRQTAPARYRKPSIIAATWFSGDRLAPAKGLIIDGRLECALAHHQENLEITKGARVSADLCAKKVTVFGHLVGNIRSDGEVFLAKGSNVSGDIHCASLYIEEGANFRGRIEMYD